MYLLADAGTERWVQYARRKAAALDASRASLRLLALTKAYAPEAGVLIWIRSTEAGTSVRITGGIAGRIYELVAAGGLSYPRYYKLPGKYGALAPLDVGNEVFRSGPKLSFGAETVAAMRQNNATLARTIDVSRANKASAVLAGPFDDTVLELSNDGTTLAAAELPRGGVRLATIGSGAASTTVSTVHTGVPQWIADFYASLALPHVLHSADDVSPPVQVDVLLSLPSAPVGACYVRTQQNGGGVGTAPYPLTVDLVYTTVHDVLVVLARMPYFTFYQETLPSPPDGTHNYEWRQGFRYEARRYVAGAWEVVYAESRPDVVRWTAGATDGNIAGSFGATVYSIGGAPVKGGPFTYVAGPDAGLLPAAPLVRSARAAPLAVMGVYAAGTELRANGAVVAALPSLASSIAVAAASGGTLLQTPLVGTYQWAGAWGVLAGIPAGQAHLSPYDGRRLLVYDFASWYYYEAGVLLLTLPGAAIDSFVAWDLDKGDRFKAVAAGKTVDMKWDAATGTLKVVKTYAARGTTPSHVPGVATKTYTEAALLQDRFVPRKLV